MNIIPAIDLINGQCVRLTKGDYNQQKVYNSNPVDVAKEFESCGIEYLHLVDLDGAKAGRIINEDVIKQICNKTALKVDFGGGVKSNAEIEKAFNLGVNQITAGSIAVKDPQLVQDWIGKYGSDKIILGADENEGKIAINGWSEKTSLDLITFVESYVDKGIKTIISTSIETDGMLQGPAFSMYQKLRLTFPELEIIASGGVSKMEDIFNLEEIGVNGVIIGKAIYEDRITIKELTDYVSKKDNTLS